MPAGVGGQVSHSLRCGGFRPPSPHREHLRPSSQLITLQGTAEEVSPQETGPLPGKEAHPAPET